MAVKVYFQHPNGTNQLVAIFDDEEDYAELYPTLESMADRLGLYLTESVDEHNLENYVLKEGLHG